MSFFQKFSLNLRGGLVTFLIFLCFISAILILVNYYSIKVTAAVRAYITGESMYSRSQKDAVRYLNQFLYFSDPEYISKYKNAIAVPKADRLARIALEDYQNYELAKEQFLLGQNHPDDIDDLIWLFRHFGNANFMTEVFDLWQEADSLIYELDKVGQELFVKEAANSLTKQEVHYYNREISELNALLSLKQHEFTFKLSETARKIEYWLFFFNLLIVLLLVSSITLVVYLILRKIHQQNRSLKIINNELDKFVYSASHDLRAPISSLKGLVAIAESENNPEILGKYFALMGQTLDRQDKFISEIISLSRNKRVGLELKVIFPEKIVTEVIESHKYMMEAQIIDFQVQINVDKLFMDESRLRIILNNLISNSIKYHDPTKENQFVKVEMRRYIDTIILSVEDNGIGIKEEYQKRVFDMFFVTESKNKGSGLGLYMLSDVLGKIEGKVELQSKWKEGTRFVITWKDFKEL